MYIIILSAKNYLYEFLSIETDYKLKHVKLPEEFTPEILTIKPSLLIIDDNFSLTDIIRDSLDFQMTIYLGDYSSNNSLKKPIDLNELLALVSRIVNKYSINNIIDINDNYLLHINNKKLINKKNNEFVILTEKEAAIIEYLYNNRGNQVTKIDILKSIWNYADDVDTHTLETHIYRLRQKLLNDSDLIITEENGYRLK